MSNEPRTDADAMVHHADRLAGLTADQRTAYLDDHAGRIEPAPKSYPKDTPRSLAAILGKDRVRLLLKRADAVAKHKATLKGKS